ncbi:MULTISPECIES: hypothetical protein [unclassified Leptolyngbya]|uniref:DUF6930 domain-containing protein n=1 Tax=unclassified Leptolyngbya TaxID=2650499 RepID=UPI00168779F9|nr:MULTISPECIES: hypothetical protein [unclassified Leptolyngbya]MBD1912467.1 hypothetical protein [Leptolyngbya sp. FACHB-8]MBD2156522.1 hypothetical protein [Leptolyngbya sp. FACHB-16]
MSGLTPATRRRLKKLRQVPSVWEGDRRLLATDGLGDLVADSNLSGDCILWVDGVDEAVRAMDMVPPDSGPEALVRTLLRAMEAPSGAQIQPARPQRILVRDREVQFFLRGVLQDLDITVDYTPDLPLIDEIFQSLQEVANKRHPHLPAEDADALTEVALNVWKEAPWQNLDEEKIISIKLNYEDIDTLYVSILGMLGMEYGILMYRSVDSLKRFRQEVLSAEDNPKNLEHAFLQQDCFFVTYDQSTAESNGHGRDGLPPIEPAFGSLHPLEGMRPILHEEEASVMLVALQALYRFFQDHLEEIDMAEFPPLTSRYRIADPQQQGKKVSVTVATLPDLAEELAEMTEDFSLDDDLEALEFDVVPVLRDDLIPRDSFYSLGAMPFQVLEELRQSVKVHQPSTTELPKKLEWFPIVLIQTTRPKAMSLIEGLQAAGGLEAICFNPGEDPINEIHYDLGILKTLDGDFHLFGEFDEEDPIHIEARKKWDQRCKKTKGQCGLVIAKGSTGASRGNPTMKDMLAFFEVRSLSPNEIGLGPLELTHQFDEL